jgi:phenylalanyl-tRNA synthetase alpha chain
MEPLTPKLYQESVLGSLDAYFNACHETGDPDTAFYRTTKELWGNGLQYRPIAGFPADMPYFCLRVPTGGGKTRLAARAVELVNSMLLRTEHSVILWLVTEAAGEKAFNAALGAGDPLLQCLRADLQALLLMANARDELVLHVALGWMAGLCGRVGDALPWLDGTALVSVRFRTSRSLALTGGGFPAIARVFPMNESIEAIQTEALAQITAARDERALEDARVAVLGKKGSLTRVSAGIKDVPQEDKAAVGQLLNAARAAITAALEAKQLALRDLADRAALAGIDVTLPARDLPCGALHPLTLIRDESIGILRRMGFALAEGPEIEDEFHCFDALNTPADHPARNEKDTFYFDSGKLLRTHTSSVQIRTMESQAPPVRIIAPGSAYRRDEIDATHLSAFNQLEGLYVDADVSLPDLKGTLEYFLHELFGTNTAVRFRPHFFPFTEPSFEIDVQLQLKGQPPRWIEVAGCGMVDPAVFDAINRSRKDHAYDPEKVTGFAFGMGLDRLAMIRWGIKDIRLLIENDVRFLRQFA